MKHLSTNTWRDLPQSSLGVFTVLSVLLMQSACSATTDHPQEGERPYHYYNSPIVIEPRRGKPTIDEGDRPKGEIYCEIMPVFEVRDDNEDIRYVTESYNTYTFNLCPGGLWDAAKDKPLDDFNTYLVEANGDPQVNKAIDVVLNGPRRFIMDDFDNQSPRLVDLPDEHPLAQDKIFSYVNRLQAQLGAQIESLDEDYRFGEGNPYEKEFVQRFTVWMYYEGSEVFLLKQERSDAAKQLNQTTVYIMQSIDISGADPLELSDLPNLADMLTAPDGDDTWSYCKGALGKKYDLVTQIEATVIHDDLGNGYQEIPIEDNSIIQDNNLTCEQLQ